ncbi:glucokinase [Ectothiorhodospiraceae bacterium 2226]|nr:glucokinase [Ectothiorhodospiraceae bacterium 2226]
MRVLAGDIGGTKTILQLIDCAATGLPGTGAPLHDRRFDSQAFPDFLPLVQEFLSGAPPGEPVAAACLGIAGPLTVTSAGQQSRLTNLPWVLDSQVLARALDIPRVRLINDFQAVGHGIELLSAGDLHTLQSGYAQAQAPRALVGAGTGLGVGMLLWQQDRYEVYATEGGHVSFAPTTEEQVDLLRYMMRKYDRVSAERLVSGAGLVDIFEFLRERAAQPVMPQLKEALTEEDPAAVISRFALSGEDPIAEHALDLFVALYGAQAGDVALMTLAHGGVFIAGGIAPKILARMKGETFLHAFNNKGRMARLTANMPVHVVLNPRVGLLGAAMVAARLID